MHASKIFLFLTFRSTTQRRAASVVVVVLLYRHIHTAAKKSFSSSGIRNADDAKITGIRRKSYVLKQKWHSLFHTSYWFFSCFPKRSVNSVPAMTAMQSGALFLPPLACVTVPLPKGRKGKRRREEKSAKRGKEEEEEKVPSENASFCRVF